MSLSNVLGSSITRSAVEVVVLESRIVLSKLSGSRIRKSPEFIVTVLKTE